MVMKTDELEKYFNYETLFDMTSRQCFDILVIGINSINVIAHYVYLQCMNI